MDLSWVKELEFLCFWIGMVPKFPQLHHPNETQTLVDIRLGINMKWTWDLLARCRKAYYRYKVLAIDFQKLRISNQKSRFTQRNGTNILPKKLETQETKNRPCGGGGIRKSDLAKFFSSKWSSTNMARPIKVMGIHVDPYFSGWLKRHIANYNPHRRCSVKVLWKLLQGKKHAHQISVGVRRTL